MALIECVNIEKQFAGTKALDGVTVRIPEGKSFGLLGPNGAGKTSLIRIINQIIKPDRGDLFFRGEKFTANHIQQIGYLPEERGLYKKMEVGEQILYLSRLKGLSHAESKKRLQFWMERFQIQGWYFKKIEELSKGMQQKVQFIVAVMHEPQLLILDEPFSGFDPVNASLIKEELLQLKKKGTTLVLSTHDMGSVEELCDEIALLHRSKVVLEGKVSNIKQNFSTNTFELSFVGNVVAFTHAIGAAAELLKHQADENHVKATVRLVGKSTPNDLLSLTLPVVQLLSFQEVVPSINDIFIQSVSSQAAAK